MNPNNWSGYGYGYGYHSRPSPNHYPNPTTIAGQNTGIPPYYYGGYGYPAWGYYPQPTGYWAAPSNLNQVQTNAAISMMPPNGDPYQSNLQEEPHKELWESPQSPQSPWIRAYEKVENEEK